MSAIEWNESLQTGVDAIDEQHHRLVEIFNELDAALQVGRAHKQMRTILDELVEYTQSHFDDEEKLMEEMGYPELAGHRIEHRQLLDKVGRFQKKLDLGQERISRPVMQFLNYWLTKHILQSDMEIGVFANAGQETESETPA